MAREPTTWIKLDRNLKDWQWVSDANTLSVFINLLIRVNNEDKPFKGFVIKRGEVVISQEELAAVTGLTRQKVRRALDNLISTKDITKSQHGRIVVISIPRYDVYQQKQPNSQPRNNHETTTTKEYKNIKNNSLSHSPSLKPYHKPTLDEVKEYERTSEQGKDPETFYKHYQSEGWKANGKKIYSWRRLYDNWQPPEISVTNRPKTFTDADGITYEWVNGNYERVRK